MRKIIKFLLVLTIMLGSASCGPRFKKMPDDFSIQVSWNNGSLPPEFRNEYVFSIGPGPQGEFEHIPGYVDEGDPNRWVQALDISESNLEYLYDYVIRKNLLRANWETGQQLIGGSDGRVIITADGEEYRLPRLSALQGSDLSTVKGAMTIFRAYVPAEVWDEMEQRQAQYQASK